MQPAIGGSTQIQIGREVIGTVEAVEDEDGRSWVATIAILPGDLA